MNNLMKDMIRAQKREQNSMRVARIKQSIHERYIGFKAGFNVYFLRDVCIYGGYTMFVFVVMSVIALIVR